MLMRVYIDVDGVLADFLTPALQIIDFFLSPKEYAENYGKYNIPEALDYPEEIFWATTNDSLFWETMLPFPWAEEMVAGIKENHQVYFVTSPTNSPLCVLAKYRWLNTFFQATTGDIIMLRDKGLLNPTDSALIDDNPENISAFAGLGILVPSNWNTSEHLPEEVFAAVKQLYAKHNS